MMRTLPYIGLLELLIFLELFRKYLKNLNMSKSPIMSKGSISRDMSALTQGFDRRGRYIPVGPKPQALATISKGGRDG